MHAPLRTALLLGLFLPSLAFADPEPEDLPLVAQALRDEGLDADQVREALTAARKAKLSALDTLSFLDASIGPVEDHGPIEGFGAFVQTRLDEGLRGDDLSSAILAEHEKRGLGKGVGKPAPAPGARPRPARPRPPVPPRPAAAAPRPAAPAPASPRPTATTRPVSGRSKFTKGKK